MRKDARQAHPLRECSLRLVLRLCLPAPGDVVTKQERNRRKMALYFLQEVHKRADAFAELLDPKRRRAYEKDPVLKALDGIVSKAARALDAEGPENWRTAWSLS